MKIKHINLEQICQLDCIYCRRNTYVKNGYRTKSFQSIVSELDTLCRENPDLEEISIRGGGEPTLLPGFIDFCRILNERGLRFSLETDGIALSDSSYLRELIDLGLTCVILNFNSYYPKIYDEITNTTGFYPRIIETLRNLETHSVVTTLNIVILRQNVDHFYKIPFFLKQKFPRLNIRSLTISLVRINSPARDFVKGSFRYSDHAAMISQNILNLERYFVIELGTGAGSFPYCIFPEITARKEGFGAQGKEDDRMHVFIDSCGKCDYRKNCPGISSTYVEIYGSDEFKPIK